MLASPLCYYQSDGSNAYVCCVPVFLHPLPDSSLPSGRTLAAHRWTFSTQHTPLGILDFTSWGDDTYVKQFTELLARDESPALNVTQFFSLIFTEMCLFISESLYILLQSAKQAQCQNSGIASKKSLSIQGIHKQKAGHS